jgi:hypothetical protein
VPAIAPVVGSVARPTRPTQPVDQPVIAPVVKEAAPVVKEAAPGAEALPGRANIP